MKKSLIYSSTLLIILVASGRAMGNTGPSGQILNMPNLFAAVAANNNNQNTATPTASPSANATQAQPISWTPRTAQSIEATNKQIDELGTNITETAKLFEETDFGSPRELLALWGQVNKTTNKLRETNNALINARNIAREDSRSVFNSLGATSHNNGELDKGINADRFRERAAKPDGYNKPSTGHRQDAAIEVQDKIVEAAQTEALSGRTAAADRAAMLQVTQGITDASGQIAANSNDAAKGSGQIANTSNPSTLEAVEAGNRIAALNGRAIANNAQITANLTQQQGVIVAGQQDLGKILRANQQSQNRTNNLLSRQVEESRQHNEKLSQLNLRATIGAIPLIPASPSPSAIPSLFPSPSPSSSPAPLF